MTTGIRVLLAVFAAEVEAGRAHGLVDPDDLYYGEPWDSELDLRALDALPGEEREGVGSDPPLPELDPHPPLPELDAGFLPRGRPGAPPGADRPARSRSSAGHRSGFASGGAWDTALPGPALAGSTDATAGADRGYAGTSDDELIGVLGRLGANRVVGCGRSAVGGGGADPPPSCHPRGARHPRQGPSLVGQILRR